MDYNQQNFVEIGQSKALLARLMAMENLYIEHKHTETASFDVKNRVLTLPILKEALSNDIYDLFTSHEVGHALWTPLYMMETVKNKKLVFSIFNIVNFHN